MTATRRGAVMARPGSCPCPCPPGEANAKAPVASRLARRLGLRTVLDRLSPPGFQYMSRSRYAEAWARFAARKPMMSCAALWWLSPTEGMRGFGFAIIRFRRITFISSWKPEMPRPCLGASRGCRFASPVVSTVCLAAREKCSPTDIFPGFCGHHERCERASPTCSTTLSVTESGETRRYGRGSWTGTQMQPLLTAGDADRPPM